MSRKPIHVSTVVVQTEHDTVLLASTVICDDGTMWQTDCDNPCGWYKLDAIPQGDDFADLREFEDDPHAIVLP